MLFLTPNWQCQRTEGRQSTEGKNSSFEFGKNVNITNNVDTCEVCG